MWKRVPDSPFLVLAAGLLCGLLGTVLVFAGLTVSTGELFRSMLVGLAATFGSTLVAILQGVNQRHHSRNLTVAASEARLDALTGLVNRNELYVQLDASRDQAVREQTVFGVLFLDLDRFKAINDSLGHDVGDDLLRIVADRLRSATRSSDVVARLGGDEFVVIARSLMTARSVEAVAAQLNKRLSQPVALRGREQQVSASIGVAISGPEDDRTADELVRDADLAMYQAKRDRTGYAVFDTAQRSVLTDRLEIERELREGLDLNQLTVYYQPIVEADSGQVYGVESLIRWRHPSRGLIGPGLFLPVADEARLMGRIGDLVLREACAQAAIWNHADRAADNFRVTVNIAEQQLVGDDLYQRVAETLTWSGLQPEQLVVEITEDVVMDHLDGLGVLRKLHDLGVHLAIDDFGTGHSSLSYIKQLDMVSILKIDKTFVQDMHEGPANMAIIEAIVAMASALELRVVAEGVETERQAQTLRDLGVPLFQGYLFAQPMTPESLSDDQGALLRRFDVSDATV